MRETDSVPLRKYKLRSQKDMILKSNNDIEIIGIKPEKVLGNMNSSPRSMVKGVSWITRFQFETPSTCSYIEDMTRRCQDMNFIFKQ